MWNSEGTASLIAKTYRYLGSHLFGERFYNQPIIECILLHASEHSTFIDIGAHVGVITTAVADRFIRCVAVEPSPANLEFLRRSVSARGWENCKVVPSALGEREGSATLYLSESNTGDNSLVRRDELSKSIKVPVTTLDRLVEQSGVVGPFLIKIDVQGCELIVLRGARRTLAGECTVVSEFWPWGLKSAGHGADQYLEFMSSQGYAAHELNGRSIPQSKLDRLCQLGDHSRFVTVDLLFMKKRH